MSYLRWIEKAVTNSTTKENSTNKNIVKSQKQRQNITEGWSKNKKK